MGKRNLESSNGTSCKISANGPDWIRICRDTKFFDKPVLGEVREAKDAWDILEKRVTSEEQEVFYVICLDSQMRVLGVSEVARGTANNMGVHLRDIFRSAIVLGSVYIIVAHNHPSGVLRPSRADTQLTMNCVRAGEIIGIDVVDHLIVTGSGYYSFSDSKTADIQKYDFYSVNEPKPKSKKSERLVEIKRRIINKGNEEFGTRGFRLSGKYGKYTADIKPSPKKHKGMKAGTLTAKTLRELESALDMLISNLDEL